jgi:plastocyanin
VNQQLHSTRLFAALGVATALTLSACGGSDDAPAAATTIEIPTVTDAPATEATDPPAPANAPASVTFDAQESDGAMITVASVELPAPGFVAVHGDGGGSPGPVVGHSALLPAGVSTDVMVMLDTPLEADATLYPMVHIDTDGNGLYEFGSVDGVDGPGLTASGDVAVVGALVTVVGGGESATPAETPVAGENEIVIAGFAFAGVTEVPVGTTVTVTNTDGSTHTWTAADGTFDSGGLAQGESFEFTFTEAGTFEYFCNIHPSMTGSIVVTG